MNFIELCLKSFFRDNQYLRIPLNIGTFTFVSLKFKLFKL